MKPVQKTLLTYETPDGDVEAALEIFLLAENGYPPVDRDEVYKEIFEQAENFKKHQGRHSGVSGK